MRKFLRYSLGVFAWLNALMVSAAEKFEILPDLPESLTAYAIQPAQAATISGVSDISSISSQSVGNEPSLISVCLSLIFVILLIYCTGIIYAKLNKVSLRTLKRQQGKLAQSHVTVISTTQLGNSKTLHVVELDGKRMLIGASSNAIQLIKDLGDTERETFDGEYSHIEIPNIKIPKIEIPKIEIPSIKFSKHSTVIHDPIEKVENSDIANETEDINTNSNEEEVSSEAIIDSLFAQVQAPNSETIAPKSEHIVDPDDFALYKKYLS